MQNSPFPIGNDGLSQTVGRPILWSSAATSDGAALLQCLFQASNKDFLVKGLFQVPERSGFMPFCTANVR
jgi:hypothetical protein